MRVLALVALCCGLQTTWALSRKRIRHEVFELSNTCRKVNVDVAKYDEVEVRSSRTNEDRPPVLAGSSCKAFFETSLPDHGLCIRMYGIMLGSHARLDFQTGPYAPERIILKNSPSWQGNFCFPHRLVAVTVMTAAYEEHADNAARFRFSVTNVTMEKIPRHYYMDTFVECGLTHTLTSGQKVSLEAERDPRVTYDLPSTCELTFETSSEDEFEQVCIEMEVLTSQMVGVPGEESDEVMKATEKHLEIQGINTRFYSSKEALRGMMACSDNKRLKLILTRNKGDTFNFRAAVSSQWHPDWEKEENEASELTGLRIVKGITYFIATIDSLVAVLAACLAAILRRPRGPWRRWAENFNAHAAAHAPQPYPPQDPANYGSMHTCKDGNYPELPLEGATPTNEVLVEAHTY